MEAPIKLMKKAGKPLLKLLFGNVTVHKLVERCSQRQNRTGMEMYLI